MLVDYAERLVDSELHNLGIYLNDPLDIFRVTKENRLPCGWAVIDHHIVVLQHDLVLYIRIDEKFWGEPNPSYEIPNLASGHEYVNSLVDSRFWEKLESIDGYVEFDKDDSVHGCRLVTGKWEENRSEGAYACRMTDDIPILAVQFGDVWVNARKFWTVYRCLNRELDWAVTEYQHKDKTNPVVAFRGERGYAMLGPCMTTEQKGHDDE